MRFGVLGPLDFGPDFSDDVPEFLTPVAADFLRSSAARKAAFAGSSSLSLAILLFNH